VSNRSERTRVTVVIGCEPRIRIDRNRHHLLLLEILSTFFCLNKIIFFLLLKHFFFHVGMCACWLFIGRYELPTIENVSLNSQLLFFFGSIGVFSSSSFFPSLHTRRSHETEEEENISLTIN